MQGGRRLAATARCGKRVTALALAALAASAAAETGFPPDESRTLGRPVAETTFVDEHGEPLALAALAGKPLVVSPIFTKCGHVCPTITLSLKQAVAAVGVPGEDFNVLSLTFDTADTEADLRAYRERLRLPAAWKLVRAASDELHPFLESIDFHLVSNVEGGFAHPNLVVFLTPELSVAKYLYGTEYAATDVRDALEIARGRRSLWDAFGPYVFLVGVLGTLGSAFVILVVRSRGRRATTAGARSI